MATEKETQDERMDWKKLPSELEDRGREIVKVGLGVLDALEEQGERILHAVRSDRGDLIDGIQKKGAETIDRLQEQANALFDDFVKRGDKVQKAGLDRMGDTMKSLADRQRNLADRIETTAERLVSGTLSRVDLPSRSEIRALTERVELLTGEVERLAALLTGEEVETGEAAFEVAPAQDGWVVRNVVTGSELEHFETKGAAVSRAREIAHSAAPSSLRILRLDGSEQDSMHYE